MSELNRNTFPESAHNLISMDLRYVALCTNALYDILYNISFTNLDARLIEEG